MIKKEIARYLTEKGRPVGEREIARDLHIRRHQLRFFRMILRELVDEEQIIRLKGHRFKAAHLEGEGTLPDDPAGEVTAILREAGLPEEFPDEVEKEAREVALFDLGSIAEKRLDLRDRVIFTIDPFDARDFDDAVSIEHLPGGGWTVGVHIADVSSYVKTGDRLDNESWFRGTSVYLVDRVIPMLPEALSNNICSLNPLEDRLTFSCFITLDNRGRRQNTELFDSIIHSKTRLTYEQAQAIIETGEDRSGTAGGDVVEALLEMSRVAELLTDERMERGTIDFDLPEPIIEMDEEGLPTAVRTRPRLASHHLIEEFMILANEAVAEYAQNLGLPFIYRVHDRPDPEKIREFREFAASLGFSSPGKDSNTPGVLSEILKRAEDSPYEPIINKILLRHMQQALYSVDNIGHFGLASRSYCHFTSPIRRYPDLMVHRLLRQYREEVPTGQALEQLEAHLRETAEHSSEMERAAMEVERETVKLKQITYMERHVGDYFSGIISGVTGFGLFVELDDLLVDGLIHISELGDDYYIFDENRYRLIGERTRREFRLGDRISIQVIRADRTTRQLDFIPVTDAEMADQLDNN